MKKAPKVFQGLKSKTHDSAKLAATPKPLSNLDGEMPARLNGLVFRIIEKEADNRPKPMDMGVDVLTSMPCRPDDKKATIRQIRK